MKKELTAVCATLLLASCGGSGHSQQQASEAEAPATETAAHPKMLCGGYNQQRPLKSEEVKLFQTVTAELDSVRYTPESVATQVVAGTNYRFICKAVTVTGQPQSYQAEIIVFQPLPNTHRAPRITAINRL